MTDKTKKLWLRRANPGQFFLYVGSDGTEITFRERWILPRWSCCRTRIETFEIHPREIKHYEVEIKNAFEYVTTRDVEAPHVGAGYSLRANPPRGLGWVIHDASSDKKLYGNVRMFRPGRA